MVGAVVERVPLEKSTVTPGIAIPFPTTIEDAPAGLMLPKPKR
jgi:hypothetical protein